jgi:predicted dehydrogenase
MDLKADAVILTTPPGFRPEEFKTAVAAGKHIFMEKPIAVDTWGCHSVLDTAEKAKAKKLSVVVGLQRRYSTAYREAQKRIASGALGAIVSGRGFYLTQDVWRGRTWPDVHKAPADAGYAGWVSAEVRSGDESYVKEVSRRLDKFFAGQDPA